MTGDNPDRIEELIVRAQGRDEEAMTELLQMHSQRLLDSVRAELGNHLRQRLESQDVMQQVYLDALGSIDRFVDGGKGSFFSWLRRIALNRIVDQDRLAFQAAKRNREVRAADLGHDASMARLLTNLTGNATSPSMAANFADRTRLLQKALEQLNEAQREVIDLRYLQNLSVADTALSMGRSERAVRSLCVRAMISLKDLLGDDL